MSAFGGSSLDIDLNAHRGVTFLSGHNQRPQAWRFMDGGSEQRHVSRQGITVNEPNTYVECGVACCTPSRSHLAPQVEVFVDWLREQFTKLYGRWLES